MNKTVKVVAHIEVNPKHLEFVLEVQKEAVEFTLKEKGCLEYKLFQEKEHPHKLTFLEEWETSEDLQAHLTTEYFLKKGDKLVGMIVRKDVHVLSEIV